jgi:hypothetical protein
VVDGNIFDTILPTQRDGLSYYINGMAGSKSAEGKVFLSLVFVVRCVGIGLCDELITHSEESYTVCVCVCV